MRSTPPAPITTGTPTYRVAHAVLATEIGRAGQHATLILEVGFGHRDAGGGRGIKGRAGLEQVDDLAAALASALDHGVQTLLRRPAHLDEVGQRNAGDRGIAHRGDHVVAVAAEHEGGDVLDRDLELVGEEITEARGVQHAGHADDLVGRQARELLQRPDHRVERVGDADDEGVGGMRLDARADGLHDFEIDADEVIAAHAGLARHAGGHDDDVGPGNVGVGTRARQLGVEALDRSGFRQIQRFALWHAIDDIEQDDVAQFLDRGQMGQGPADLTCADQSNLLPRHELSVLI